MGLAMRPAGGDDLGLHGRQVHDGPAPGGGDGGRQHLRADELALEVHVDHEVPLLVRKLIEPGHWRYSLKLRPVGWSEA